jgi:hypothetical protein
VNRSHEGSSPKGW